MSNIIVQICSQFAIPIIIRIVYTILFAVIRYISQIRNFRDYFGALEQHFVPPLVAMKSGYCQTTRIDLFLSRRSFDEETNDLLTIAAKFPGEVFDWIRLTYSTVPSPLFVCISFKKEVPAGS